MQEALGTYIIETELLFSEFWWYRVSLAFYLVTLPAEPCSVYIQLEFETNWVLEPALEILIAVYKLLASESSTPTVHKSS